MVQNKLPLINSAHGSETRNIINELIKLFNGMGYTYNEALNKAHDILNEAQQTNDMNESVQQQINTLIAESGTSDSEVLQARIDVEGNEYPVLKERLDEKEQNFSAQLTQIAVNVKDFGAKGDGVTDDTEAIQSCFDHAKNIRATNVIVPDATYIINSTGLDYAVPNSNLHCDGVFKHVDEGVELYGSIFKANASNINIYNLKIDGNRAENLYDSSGGRGHQFSISSYGKENINFIGGWSIDAIQNHCQFTSNVTIKNFNFENSGEHSVYLTTNADTVGPDYANFENCKFKNWGLVVEGYAISGRDYFLVQAIGCTFEVDKGEATGYVTAFSHRDTITDPTKKSCVYRNCTFSSEGFTNGIFIRNGINAKIENCVIDGAVRTDDVSENNTEVYNTTLVRITPFGGTIYPARKYINCKFIGGRFRPVIDYDVINCDIYYTPDTSTDFFNNFFERENADFNKIVISGNTFHNFIKTESSALGIITCNPNIREVITNNNFVNCGDAYGVARVSKKTIVMNNHDISDSGVRINGEPTNTNVLNNSLIDIRS